MAGYLFEEELVETLSDLARKGRAKLEVGWILLQGGGSACN